MKWEIVSEFEQKVAKFFGAPYAIGVDCCTHGIELCLRYTQAKFIECPKHTYISIPMLSYKLGIKLIWKEDDWKNYYYLTHNIIDAAILWQKNSYIPNTFMNLSFQFQKHLNLIRGGMILTDNKKAAINLKKMSHDGRLPNVPWRRQNIETIGYHYYMTPETAALGLKKLDKAIKTTPSKWTLSDWPDITQMKVFNEN